jgi:hypothetical protein
MRRTPTQFGIVRTLGLATVLVAVVAASPAVPAAAVTSPEDALERRVRADLAVFTDWLAAHGAKGYIGEVGWPAEPGAEQRWNALAAAWFRDAEAAGLGTAVWATGEWWGTGYPLSPYVAVGAGLDTARAQATVLERQSASRRGINLAGAEFGTPGALDAFSPFSNRSPGRPDVDYRYDGQASVDYLARRGLTTVRLPFRWERIQRNLRGPLDPDEVARLRAAVARARSAGLAVVLDLHNYGAYWLFDGERGVRRPVGDPEVGIEHFADLWHRLSLEFKDDQGVTGYGLMNEPVDLPTVGDRTPAQVWEEASQRALAAIRATGDGTEVLVAGYLWSPTWRWSSVHPHPWIHDPLDRFRYEAHQYFDHDRSGTYARSFDEEALLAVAVAEGPAGSPQVAARPIDRSCPPTLVPVRFEDVDPAAAHGRAIGCVAAWGIAAGRGGSRFDPGGAVTRAQMATFLARLLHTGPHALPAADPGRFTDLGDGPHADSIGRLAAAGIAAGLEDGRFDPGGAVTRAQMATFLARSAAHHRGTALPAGPGTFSDLQASVHVASVDALAAQGIATGVAPHVYAPREAVTRAQMASFLARLLDLLVVEGHAAVPR